MRGIVFDIDDTLYTRQDMLVRAAEITLGVTVPNPREFIRIFYEKSEVNMAGLESGRVTTREINGWRYIETYKILGLPYSPDDGVLAADAYLELQSHMSLSEGLTDLLDKLSKIDDLKLAILTAGESKHQRNKVTMLGLDRWFAPDDIIVTGETGYTKPDIELFRMMEKKLGLDPSSIWMIGDSYKHDIEGAIGAGWHSVWINRRRLPSPAVSPDIEVDSDDELIKALARVFL